MTGIDDLSPSVRQALEATGMYLKTQHALFKDIPFRPKSVGRGEASILVTIPDHFDDGNGVHGGFYTILLDTVLAVAAWTRMEEFEPMVTINLKTDFYKSIQTGTEVEFQASCEGIVDQVAVCHGRVASRAGQVLAHAAGTFLVGGPAPEKGSRL